MNPCACLRNHQTPDHARSLQLIVPERDVHQFESWRLGIHIVRDDVARSADAHPYRFGHSSS